MSARRRRPKTRAAEEGRGRRGGGGGRDRGGSGCGGGESGECCASDVGRRSAALGWGGVGWSGNESERENPPKGAGKVIGRAASGDGSRAETMDLGEEHRGRKAVQPARRAKGDCTSLLPRHLWSALARGSGQYIRRPTAGTLPLQPADRPGRQESPRKRGEKGGEDDTPLTS